MNNKLIFCLIGTSILFLIAWQLSGSNLLEILNGFVGIWIAGVASTLDL